MSDNAPQFESVSRRSATVLAIWRRRRWLAIGCLAVPLSAALSAAAFLPDRYRSTALVEVHQEARPGVADPAGGTTIEQQLQRLNEQNLSRGRLQALIERFGLYPQLRLQGSPDGAIEQLRKDITIELKDADHVWGRSTGAFQLSFRGRDAAKVAQVTNELASFYVDKGREQRLEQAGGLVARLGAQVEEAKARLAVEEKRVSDFMALHLLELPEQVRANLAVVERLNSRLALNRLPRSRAHALRASADGALAVAGPDQPELELARLDDELAGLKGRATERHPDVVRLREEIAALSAAPVRRRPVAPPLVLATPHPEELPAPDLGPQEEERRSLTQNIAAAEQRVFNAPKREQELRSLLQPYDDARLAHGALVARLEEARFADAFERQHAVEPFVLLDRAVPSRTPIAPDRLRLAAGGLFLALLFAFGAVAAAEKLDTSFHSLDELRAFTLVPVLVSVPGIVVARDTALLQRRNRWLAALLVLAVFSSGAGTWALVHDNEPLVWMLSRGRA